MTENRICDPWLLEQELVKRIRQETIKAFGNLKEIIRNDVVEFSNYPEDDLSIHLLRLISLHLSKMTNEQKTEIINTINKQLDIKERK